MEFTFGIVTGGVRNPREQLDNRDVALRITRMIASIISQKIEKFEIMIVGGEDYYSQYDCVEHIEFDEGRRIFRKLGRKIPTLVQPAYISRKKNIIVERSSYENIVFMHDYYALEATWYHYMLEFGNSFHIQMNSIIDVRGSRYYDWILKDVPELNGECILPYDIEDLTPYQYISGGYWVAKREVMQQYPLNESLVWGEGEDVEWSDRVKTKYKFVINPKSKVLLLKDRFIGSMHKPVSGESIQYLRKLQSL